MKVKFVLRDGQTITTNSFKNGLEDYLYRALKESGKTSVFIIKAENDTFLFRVSDILWINHPELRCSAPAEARDNKCL